MTDSQIRDSKIHFLSVSFSISKSVKKPPILSAVKII